MVRPLDDLPRRPFLLSGLSLASPAPFGELVEVDAEHHDHADDDWLVVGVDVVDRESAVEHADEERSREGS
jgi:hypothetical protein